MSCESAANSLRRALDSASIPTLLSVLLYATEDPRWTAERFQVARMRGLDEDESGGLPPDAQAEVRDAACRLLDEIGGDDWLQPTRTVRLTEILARYVGEAVPQEYEEMLEHELSVAADPAAWLDRHGVAPRDFKVLVVGAGLSGIAAAVALHSAGYDFVVVDQQDRIGGSWTENRYPGCGVDTPSHLYSYSFAPHRWSRYFAEGGEIRDYVEGVAEQFGLRDRIRLGTTVTSLRFDEVSRRWEIDLESASEGARTITAEVVISAVGAFNNPVAPDLRGLETFTGEVAHTARWPDSLDLRGKRVAVIGTGASAMQLVPAIAREVDSLTVFQRTPQWVAPFPQHGMQVPEGLVRLLDESPLYRAWFRIRLGWTFNDKNYLALRRDPRWPHQRRSVSAANDGHRQYFTRYLQGRLAGRPDLVAKCLPDYPPFGKRILLDNGWYDCLTLPNVELVAAGVDRVAPAGVVGPGGEVLPADVIVFATGFNVVEFLSTIEVRGRGGVTLSSQWADEGARAYLGTAIPNFPNFFCLYGPNTQAGHGGSLISVVELQIRYVMNLLATMHERGADCVEVRADVHDRYNERVDAEHAQMIWTHPGFEIYYRNRAGRVVVNSPFRIVDYWALTRSVKAADYVFTPRATAEIEHTALPGSGSAEGR